MPSSDRLFNNALHQGQRCAGCKEKKVAGTTESRCALASASASPFEVANTLAFDECFDESTTLLAEVCGNAGTQHLEAAGCNSTCSVAFLGRVARGGMCATATTRTACEAKTVPCDGASATKPSLSGIPAVAPEPASDTTSGSAPPSAQGLNDQGGVLFLPPVVSPCLPKTCRGWPAEAGACELMVAKRVPLALTLPRS